MTTQFDGAGDGRGKDCCALMRGAIADKPPSASSLRKPQFFLVVVLCQIGKRARLSSESLSAKVPVIAGLGVGLCQEVWTWIDSVAFSPNGTLALSGGNNGTVKLWDLVVGRLVRTFNGDAKAVHAVAFSPDGNSVLS